MPWDMNDYPSSLKNFSKAKRKKAIDIANSLIDDGYDENRAIPIATEQAKEWYENASEKERQDYLDIGTPKTHDSPYKSRPELLEKPEMVIPHEDNKWAVQSKDAKQPSKIFDHKEEAIQYGKQIAKNQEVRLIIQKKDGSKDKELDYSV